jgi:hypothetical protein
VPDLRTTSSKFEGIRSNTADLADTAAASAAHTTLLRRTIVAAVFGYGCGETAVKDKV